jgi:hypothetical protein
MKNIKFFEQFFDTESYFVFSDDSVKIHKILYGENKGKIQFRFFNEKGQEFSDKYSMMAGVAKLLNTKYANLSKVREITLGPVLFRKVPTNTMNSIITSFTKKIDLSDYHNPDDKEKFLINRILNSTTTLRFEDRIREIALKSENLGEIFDKLKIVSDEANEFQKEVYDKMKLDLQIKKYNI